MLKRFTFVRRDPSIAAEGFAAALADFTHDNSAATGSDSRPVRVGHFIARARRVPGVYDAAICEWFVDADAMTRFDDAIAGRRAAAPYLSAEAETAVVEERTVFGQEELDRIWGEADPQPRFVIVGLLARKAGLTVEQYRDYWWDKHRVLANSLLPAETQPPAYIHNYATGPRTCSWDGIGELYDVDLAQTRLRTTWTATAPEAAPLMADELEFMDIDVRQVLVSDLHVVIRP